MLDPCSTNDDDTTPSVHLQAMTSCGMLTASSMPSWPRRRTSFHCPMEDTSLGWPARRSLQSPRHPRSHQEPPIQARPRSRYRGVRRRPPDQQPAFDQHWLSGQKSGPAPRRTKPQDAAPQDRLQVTRDSMPKPSATSRSFPPLPKASSNLSNAPAQPRRAHVPGESTPHLLPAGGCSGLLDDRPRRLIVCTVQDRRLRRLPAFSVPCCAGGN